MSVADAGAGVAGALAEVGGGDGVGGFDGCWPGRGNGAGLCPRANVGAVSRTAASANHRNLTSNMILLSHRNVSHGSTSKSATIHGQTERTDGLTSKIRRLEESKTEQEEQEPAGAPCASRTHLNGVRRAGLRAGNREPENRRYKQLGIRCCSYLGFSSSLARGARGGERASAASHLRIFAVGRGPVSARQRTMRRHR